MQYHIVLFAFQPKWITSEISCDANNGNLITMSVATEQISNFVIFDVFK